MPDATTSRRMARAIRWTIGAAAAALVIGGGAYGWLGGPGGDSARSPPVAPASRPVPVTAGTAITKAFPIYRVGLGTVQAYNTVTIRVRVDGEVQKIAFREGQDVQQGDLLAQIDPRPYQALLEQARADKARDEALLANAKLDLDRYSTLVVKDFATHQSVDTQKALVAQYQAAIQHDQAAIDNAQVQLGYTTITSPLTGRTGIRLIDQGNIMHASDAGGLVVITQLKPIAVIFTLPQQYLPEIVDAMRRGPAPVEAYDQDNLVELGAGHLELIDNQIDQGIGSVRLKAIFPNDDGRLWPGEFVNARLRLDVRRGVVVPESVVQSGPGGAYAFVIGPGSAVEVRQLSVAATQQGEALIAKGLSAGERVVVDGQYRLRPGTRVVVSAPKPDGEKTAEAKAQEITR
ncbi:MAG TPA: efflux RND transporter periplasmic adaptor subunit [Xanthobacteraceae bacterium]|jgi:membrane fusion protein, multidrug efflux system